MNFIRNIISDNDKCYVENKAKRVTRSEEVTFKLSLGI